MGALEAPREAWLARLRVPNYAPVEVGRLAGISRETIRRWRKAAAINEVRPGTPLSYLELIEIAVVASARNAGMKLNVIIEAHTYLSREFREEFPFASMKLKTDGIDMFKDYGRSNRGVGHLLVANRHGQLAWQDFLAERFREFEYERGIAARWHVGGIGSPVVIDPRVRFGAPHVKGIPTWLVKERLDNGEPVSSIAEDLSLDNQDIDAAFQFEAGRSGPAQIEHCLN